MEYLKKENCVFFLGLFGIRIPESFMCETQWVGLKEKYWTISILFVVRFKLQGALHTSPGAADKPGQCAVSKQDKAFLQCS